MTKESKLTSKVGGLTPINWVSKTAKQVFSRKNLNEYGVPVMTGFTLYAGLDTFGFIDGMFQYLGIEGTPKEACYTLIGPSSKLGCYAVMKYDEFVNTNYKQIAKDTVKDVVKEVKNVSNKIENKLSEFAEVQKENPTSLMFYK